MPLPSLSDTPDLLSVSALREAAIRFAQRVRHTLPGVQPDEYASLAEFLIDHGRGFVSAPLPADCECMKSGRCIENAFRLSQWTNGRLLYCEGYAGPYGHHHAWCFDLTAARVVDPTWGHYDGMPYFGAAFPGFSGDSVFGPTVAEMRRRSITQSREWSYALPAIAAARRGQPMFGPWLTERLMAPYREAA